MFDNILDSLQNCTITYFKGKGLIFIMMITLTSEGPDSANGVMTVARGILDA